jgi:hypothetical protein
LTDFQTFLGYSQVFQVVEHARDILKAYAKPPRKSLHWKPQHGHISRPFWRNKPTEEGQTADLFTMHMLSISENAVMSPKTSPNGTHK